MATLTVSMNKVLKIIGVIASILLLVGVGTSLYVFRQQEIAIRFIPSEFEYCGKKVWGNDKHYQEIVTWLKKNKDGWVLSYVTYVPKQVYKHPAFNVNVLEGGVVVSYKTDYGYPQYVKTISHGINLECTSNS